MTDTIKMLIEMEIERRSLLIANTVYQGCIRLEGRIYDPQGLVAKSRLLEKVIVETLENALPYEKEVFARSAREMDAWEKTRHIHTTVREPKSIWMRLLDLIYGERKTI